MNNPHRFLTAGPLAEYFFVHFARQMQKAHTTVALLDNSEGVRSFHAGQDAEVHAERQISVQSGDFNLWVTKAPCLQCMRHMLSNVGKPGLFVCFVPIPTSKWFQSSTLAIQLLRNNGYEQQETDHPLIVLKHSGRQVLEWD